MTAVMKTTPSMTETEQDAASGSIKLFEEVGKRTGREVILTANLLLCSATDEIPDDERAAFLENVVRAAEENLGFTIFDLVLLEYLHVFRIEHRGNHHELIAETLCGGSAVGHLARAYDGPLTNATFGVNTAPQERYDLEFALVVRPQTVLKEIRNEDYDGNQIEIHAGLAQVRGFSHTRFSEILSQLSHIWEAEFESIVRQHVVDPLQHAATT